MDYSKKTLPKLKEIAQRKFNKFIRERDSESGWYKCICCGKTGSKNNMHAGHYYSQGHYEILRFNENNCHGCCPKCNTFLHGNLIEYRKGLVKKIGVDAVEGLDRIAEQGKQIRGKVFDRFDLIEIINRYK